MTPAGFRHAFGPALRPALVVLLLMAGGQIIYNLPWFELAPGLHQPMTMVSALILNFSLVFGPSLIYPSARSCGAPVPVGVGCSLVPPLVWNIWEVIRVAEYFSPGVALYYGLNSLFLGALFFGFFQMGLWETIYRVRRQPRPGRLLAPLVVSGLSLAAVYIMMIRGLGAQWFYWYGKGYQALFQ